LLEPVAEGRPQEAAIESLAAILSAIVDGCGSLEALTHYRIIYIQKILPSVALNCIGSNARVLTVSRQSYEKRF
jgi:hypothetical protein